ncbi:MAG: hypothetical protein V1872_09825 [bacterium]
MKSNNNIINNNTGNLNWKGSIVKMLMVGLVAVGLMMGVGGRVSAQMMASSMGYPMMAFAPGVGMVPVYTTSAFCYNSPAVRGRIVPLSEVSENSAVNASVVQYCGLATGELPQSMSSVFFNSSTMVTPTFTMPSGPLYISSATLSRYPWLMNAIPNLMVTTASATTDVWETISTFNKDDKKLFSSPLGKNIKAFRVKLDDDSTKNGNIKVEVYTEGKVNIVRKTFYDSDRLRSQWGEIDISSLPIKINKFILYISSTTIGSFNVDSVCKVTEIKYSE